MFLAPIALYVARLDQGSVSVKGGETKIILLRPGFQIGVPTRWWFRDDFREWGLALGEPVIGGGAGKGTWDPSFMVLKHSPGRLSELLKRLKNNPKDATGPQFVTTGRVGFTPYKVWTALGWTYVDGYVKASDAIWEIQVHVPKANWKKSLPLALDIIRSFKLTPKGRREP